jgi:hypothetical protein
MGYRSFSRNAFAGTQAKVAAAGGDTTSAGREEMNRTGKLHPLVDPAGFGLIRKSWPRYVELPDGHFHNIAGIPMLFESLLDTTGSMSRNIKLAFNSLPKLYDLLTNGEVPVLGRYDTQIINSIFGDVVDDFILARAQAEMDEKIAEQLTLMVAPNGGGGGNGGEDPEYGFFAAAYLTDSFVTRYGLKSYHMTVTDEPSHGYIDKGGLVRVFGEEVFEKVAENGYEINPRNLPDTAEIVSDLKKRAHAFMISVDGNNARYWAQYYGAERVVVIDSTANLAYVQAALIGLTEGVLDLQSLYGYLRDFGCNEREARAIQRAVAGIPIGAQCALPNFDKIPEKGMVFAQKHDLWPIEASTPTAMDSPPTKWL